MSVTTSIERLANDIGFDIGLASDTSQADLINGMARGFKTFRGSQSSMQMAYMVDKLDKDAEEFVRALAGAVEAKTEKPL